MALESTESDQRLWQDSKWRRGCARRSESKELVGMPDVNLSVMAQDPCELVVRPSYRIG